MKVINAAIVLSAKRCFAKGDSITDIADRLGLSAHQVKLIVQPYTKRTNRITHPGKAHKK